MTLFPLSFMENMNPIDLSQERQLRPEEKNAKTHVPVVAHKDSPSTLAIKMQQKVLDVGILQN